MALDVAWLHLFHLACQDLPSTARLADLDVMMGHTVPQRQSVFGRQRPLTALLCLHIAIHTYQLNCRLIMAGAQAGRQVQHETRLRADHGWRGLLILRPVRHPIHFRIPGNRR